MANDDILYGHIAVIKRNGDDKTRFPMASSTCLCGRDKNSDIRIYNRDVAWKHCILSANTDKKVYLIPLQLENPTLLNGLPVLDRVELIHNDIFTIVDRHFRFEYPQHTHFYIKSVSPPVSPIKVIALQLKSPASAEHRNPVEDSGDAIGCKSLVFVNEESEVSCDAVQFQNHYVQKNCSSNSPKSKVTQNVAKVDVDLPLLSTNLRRESCSVEPHLPASKKRLISKRMSTPGISSLMDYHSGKKHVTFGPTLSPEQFDRTLPPASPLKRGSLPRFVNSSLSDTVSLFSMDDKKSDKLLKRTSNHGGINVIYQKTINDENSAVIVVQKGETSASSVLDCVSSQKFAEKNMTVSNEMFDSLLSQQAESKSSFHKENVDVKKISMKNKRNSFRKSTLNRSDEDNLSSLDSDKSHSSILQALKPTESVHLVNPSDSDIYHSELLPMTANINSKNSSQTSFKINEKNSLLIDNVNQEKSVSHARSNSAINDVLPVSSSISQTDENDLESNTSMLSDERATKDTSSLHKQKKLMNLKETLSNSFGKIMTKSKLIDQNNSIMMSKNDNMKDSIFVPSCSGTVTNIVTSTPCHRALSSIKQRRSSRITKVSSPVLSTSKIRQSRCTRNSVRHVLKDKPLYSEVLKRGLVQPRVNTSKKLKKLSIHNKGNCSQENVNVSAYSTSNISIENFVSPITTPAKNLGEVSEVFKATQSPTAISTTLTSFNNSNMSDVKELFNSLSIDESVTSKSLASSEVKPGISISVCGEDDIKRLIGGLNKLLEKNRTSLNKNSSLTINFNQSCLDSAVQDEYDQSELLLQPPPSIGKQTSYSVTNEPVSVNNVESCDGIKDNDEAIKNLNNSLDSCVKAVRKRRKTNATKIEKVLANRRNDLNKYNRRSLPLNISSKPKMQMSARKVRQRKQTSLPNNNKAHDVEEELRFSFRGENIKTYSRVNPVEVSDYNNITITTDVSSVPMMVNENVTPKLKYSPRQAHLLVHSGKLGNRSSLGGKRRSVTSLSKQIINKLDESESKKLLTTCSPVSSVRKSSTIANIGSVKKNAKPANDNCISKKSDRYSNFKRMNSQSPENSITESEKKKLPRQVKSRKSSPRNILLLKSPTSVSPVKKTNNEDILFTNDIDLLGSKAYVTNSYTGIELPENNSRNEIEDSASITVQNTINKITKQTGTKKTSKIKNVPLSRRSSSFSRVRTLRSRVAATQKRLSQTKISLAQNNANMLKKQKMATYPMIEMQSFNKSLEEAAFNNDLQPILDSRNLSSLEIPICEQSKKKGKNYKNAKRTSMLHLQRKSGRPLDSGRVLRKRTIKSQLINKKTKQSAPELVEMNSIVSQSSSKNEVQDLTASTESPSKLDVIQRNAKQKITVPLDVNFEEVKISSSMTRKLRKRKLSGEEKTVLLTDKREVKKSEQVNVDDCETNQSKRIPKSSKSKNKETTTISHTEAGELNEKKQKKSKSKEKSDAFVSDVVKKSTKHNIIECNLNEGKSKLESSPKRIKGRKLKNKVDKENSEIDILGNTSNEVSGVTTKARKKTKICEKTVIQLPENVYSDEAVSASTNKAASSNSKSNKKKLSKSNKLESKSKKKAKDLLVEESHLILQDATAPLLKKTSKVPASKSPKLSPKKRVTRAAAKKERQA